MVRLRCRWAAAASPPLDSASNRDSSRHRLRAATRDVFFVSESDSTLLQRLTNFLTSNNSTARKTNGENIQEIYAEDGRNALYVVPFRRRKKVAPESGAFANCKPTSTSVLEEIEDNCKMNKVFEVTKFYKSYSKP